MRGASFRDMAGVEATGEDVSGMLKLNETLFVEHKGAGPELQLAKAMASFANQLGGWVLVNIGSDGRPLGPLQDWVRQGASPVDVIRDRLQGQLDPMPPFEARTFALEHAEDDVLLIRVYESADTPHIVGDGAIYIRAVAQDRRRDKYEARAIENQQTLRALVERGERSRARTDELLAPRRHGLPLANKRVGLGFSPITEGQLQAASDGGPMVCVRLAPHTLPGRFSGWARSAAAVATAEQAIAGLTGPDRPTEVEPHSQGFSLRTSMSEERSLKTEMGTSLSGPVRLALDAAGVLSASTIFADRRADDWCDPITVDGFAGRFIAPVLELPASVLEAGAMLGRVSCHFWILGMSGLLRIEEEGRILGGCPPVPFLGEITLPRMPGEVERVAGEVGRALAREAGSQSFE
jgi:hypothetical protein